MVTTFFGNCCLRLDPKLGSASFIVLEALCVVNVRDDVEPLADPPELIDMLLLELFPVVEVIGKLNRLPSASFSE